MNRMISVGLIFAAGCGEHARNASTELQRPEYPKWVCQAAIPNELRIAHPTTVRDDQSEDGRECLLRFEIYRVVERTSGQNAPIFERLLQTRSVRMTAGDRDRLRRELESNNNVKLVSVVDVCARNGQLCTNVCGSSTSGTDEFILAAKPTDVNSDSARIEFAAQGTIGTSGSESAQHAAWQVSGNQALAKQQSYARLADAVEDSASTVVLVRLLDTSGEAY